MFVSDRYRQLLSGILCWIFGMFTPIALGESEFERNHVAEDVGAHVHGEASMQVSLQGSSLNVRLVIPAMDLLGYERPPQTAKERTRSDAALDFFEHPNNWIKLIAEPRCTLQSQTLDHPYQTDEQHAEQNVSRHHDTKTVHTDFVINVTWHCASAGRLDTLTILLFEQFPHVRQVKVDWISDADVGVARLDANEPRLFLNASQ